MMERTQIFRKMDETLTTPKAAARMPGWGLTAFVAAALAALSGCVVGPDYQRPAAVTNAAMPAMFSEPLPTNAGVWKAAEPVAHVPRGAWWEIFGDAELNRLETLATTNNQELAGALARFEQARAQVTIARADYFPQLSLGPSAQRQRTSASARSSTTANSFSVPLDASWEIDLWGRIRRQVTGARENLQALGDDIEAAKLAIQAEVAADYFQLVSLDDQYALLKQTITTFERSLALTQNRQKGGIATDLDVSLAETQLKSAEAQLPAVELQRHQMAHAIATLCGQPAPTFDVKPVIRPLPEQVPMVPASLPSELLEHRPDIAAAERRMAAANENIGVARAAFYPRLLLSGLAGFQSIDAGTLFNWPNRVWAIGPSVQVPLFTGGRTRAQVAVATAEFNQAVANYRQTVLGAFQEVEDHLAAQRFLAKQYDDENAALQSARRTLEIALNRYKGGVITYLEVASDQTAELAHHQTVVRLRAQRLAACAALVKSLGAGWSAPVAEAKAGKGEPAK